jgi:hypothetical protein
MSLLTVYSHRHMSAIVVDLKDTGVRTPEQGVRVFYESFDPEEVRAGLWEAFRGFSLATTHTIGKQLPDIKAIAQLFDGLISLVNGVYDLQIKTNGRCVICGRRGNGGPSGSEGSSGIDDDDPHNAG